MQQIVEFCPQKKLIHTGVQPEHDHHDARQTAVHIDKTMGIIEINSKNAGSDHPSDGAGYCSRQHIQQRCLLIRQHLVNKDEKHRQQSENDQHTDTDDKGSKLMQHRQKFDHLAIKNIAKYQKTEGHSAIRHGVPPPAR